MERHHQNKNLSVTYEPSFLGLPVQTENGPLVVEYLQRLHTTLSLALNDYPRVFAFRIDLRMPVSMAPEALERDNKLIERFIASFKAKLRHNRDMAMRTNKRAHTTTVRYVWARETGKCGKPHYHLSILLNNDAFCALGIFVTGRDNLFNRLNEAWASALGISIQSAMGLVEFPQNPCYWLHRTDQAGIASFFYRSSYLCKTATKHYGAGCHGFGASRT